MKEYFSHDYNARNDLRMVRLQMKHGLTGIGAYWCILEMLYEEGGYLFINEYERITFELRTTYELITSVIQDFELFQNDGEKFWSKSALLRLKERVNKSEKARQSISKRWEKYERNTNVIRTKYERDTIKVKESKEKRKIKEKITHEEFYKNQLELSGNDVNYKKYIEVLYGDNKAGIKLTGVLSLPEQMTYKHFTDLLSQCKAKGKSLIQYTLDLENNKKYYEGRKSLYLILNKWLNKDE